MNDNVRRQQLRFMCYNLIAFTLIFTLFGAILYTQMRASLYGPVEDAMGMGRKIIEESDEYVERQLYLQENRSRSGGGEPPFTQADGEGQGKKEPGDQTPPGEQPPRDSGGWPGEGAKEPGGGQHLSVPMRVQTIVRDDTGAVLNPGVLGRLYFDGFLEEVPFDLQSLDKTTAMTVGETSYLSVLCEKTMADGRLLYVQIISDLDGERSILDNFFRLLVLCIAVLIALSITASYLLSRMTMMPLIKSWRRQTEFVENASHELRTPLTIIQNKLESLLVKPDSTVMEKAEEIGVTLSETRRLAKLTADLMTLARADSSETQLDRESLEVDTLIAAVVEPYRELAELQQKLFTMELRCGQEIFADKSRIHQLMVILLDNALKYTGEGDCIAIRTYCRDNRAVIEVADTGIGIPPDALERVFDRFYRADKARGRATGGSGLGLSIAKWIVDSHQGSITAHQNGGDGTVFRVRLRLP